MEIQQSLEGSLLPSSFPLWVVTSFVDSRCHEQRHVWAELWRASSHPARCISSESWSKSVCQAY